MAFAFGEHRERWQRTQARAKQHMRDANEVAFTDVERANFMFRRNQHAFTCLTLPDEIVAEQRLKRDYAEWFERRAEYYVRMRQARESEIAEAHPDDPLWPFRVFYELLCIELYIPLVEGVLPGLEDALRRLQGHAERRLRECGSPEFVESLLELKPRLLDVSHEAALDRPELAYEDLFSRIIATEPRGTSVTPTSGLRDDIGSISRSIDPGNSGKPGG